MPDAVERRTDFGPPHYEKFLPHFRLRAPVVPAALFNSAGIVGAAALASEEQRRAIKRAERHS